MSKLRTLADAISGRPGQAAIAVALILNASAAFAEGDRAEGRRLVGLALTEQAQIQDAPQDDTVLTAEERTMLRTLASELLSECKKRQAPPDFASTDQLSDCRPRRAQLDPVSAAAIDLISTAGMVSRRRADAEASLRMVLASTSADGLTGQVLNSVLTDVLTRPLKFEVI